jgi:hypothetical protein
VLLPAVYAALERLERRRLVVSSVGDPTPERGGRAKSLGLLALGALVTVARPLA